MSPDFRFDLLITGEKIAEDYFTFVADNIGIVSGADTELIRSESGKSLEKLFAHNMIETVIMLQFGHEHDPDEEEIGCLFDSCYYKRGNFVLGLRACIVCDDCVRALIEENHAPREQLEAVRSVLRWIKMPPAKVTAKWAASVVALVAGGALLFSPDTTNAALISLTLSGWITAVPL